MNNKTKNILMVLLGSLIIFGSIYAASQNDNAKAQSNNGPNATLTLGSLTFSTSISDVLHNAQAKDKMIYIYGRSQFCGWCKKFESESFTDERIVSLMNEHFILLSIDTVDQRNTAIDLGIRGTPTSIFTTPEGQEIPGTRVPGYTDPDSFFTHLNDLINTEE